MEEVRDMRLSAQTFAVVDVETTGMSAQLGDRICELGLVVARGGEVVDTLQTLVNPGRRISSGASAVNGITDRMVRTAPGFRVVAPAFTRAVEGAVLVAHNAAFDLSFISAELKAAGHGAPENPVLDTLALARRFYRFPSNRLGEITRSLGIVTHGLHRALADASATWLVLKRFLADFQASGVTTLPELLALQGSLTPLGGWRMGLPVLEWDGSALCPIEGLPPLIEQALRARTPLRIAYIGGDGKRSERVVEPRKITLREQATYLVAYCQLKREERTFRIDRIVELTLEEALG